MKLVDGTCSHINIFWVAQVEGWGPWIVYHHFTTSTDPFKKRPKIIIIIQKYTDFPNSEQLTLGVATQIWHFSLLVHNISHIFSPVLANKALHLHEKDNIVHLLVGHEIIEFLV